jgi:signal transduction histidine kinase
VFSTAPLIAGDDKRAGAVAVIRDETDARAMAMQVRRAERLSAMGQLAAGVAHEIRNPLNSIALASQQLKLELSGTTAAMADTIWAESKRLNLIVDDFLSLARPSTHAKSLVDLIDLVTSIAQMARLEADKNGVDLRLQLPESCTVSGIADELRKAVWNLIRNALAATPPGGAIVVLLAVDRETASLTIDDTGSGIAPEALPRVFEPWYTTKPGGTGLGLAITHRIVQDHDGTIEAISPVPGQPGGTRVLLRLPLIEGR